MKLLPFPTDVDRLWAEYRTLALQVSRNPYLADDRHFMAHVIRAHRLFASAYDAWCRA